jgi:hypothetical protein
MGSGFDPLSRGQTYRRERDRAGGSAERPPHGAGLRALNSPRPDPMHWVTVILAGLLALAPGAHAFESGAGIAAAYQEQVDRRLAVPAQERQRYAGLLAAQLRKVDLSGLQSQYFVLVDRNPHVQAVMIYWMSPSGEYFFVGASPASTGRPGEFEHFQTPVGVFEHSIANFDFRSEGTKNSKGIRGYGEKGMRVYDFGWQRAQRGWGAGGESAMRLQIHSTDPDLLERQVGSPQSKGCIRIPATLNAFIDRYGLLDADYEWAMVEGKNIWVLRPDREATPWSGRYLVIVDSQSKRRPDWARHRPESRDSPVSERPYSSGLPGD